MCMMKSQWLFALLTDIDDMMGDADTIALGDVAPQFPNMTLMESESLFLKLQALPPFVGV